MKYIDWDPKKNKKLIEGRGISFDTVVAHIESNKVLDRIKHPNKTEYPNQWMYVVEIDDYVYVIPFVIENEEKIFLKTIIPSRKFTKKYLNK